MKLCCNKRKYYQRRAKGYGAYFICVKRPFCRLVRSYRYIPLPPNLCLEGTLRVLASREANANTQCAIGRGLNLIPIDSQRLRVFLDL